MRRPTHFDKISSPRAVRTASVRFLTSAGSVTFCSLSSICALLSRISSQSAFVAGRPHPAKAKKETNATEAPSSLPQAFAKSGRGIWFEFRMIRCMERRHCPGTGPNATTGTSPSCRDSEKTSELPASCSCQMFILMVRGSRRTASLDECAKRRMTKVPSLLKVLLDPGRGERRPRVRRLRLDRSNPQRHLLPNRGVRNARQRRDQP